MKEIELEVIRFIQQEFQYDKDTGALTRKKKQGVKSEVVGARNQEGFYTVGVTVNGQTRLVKKHRLCWLLAYGTMPKRIEFVDGNKENFKLENLRVKESVKIKITPVEKIVEKGPDYSAIYATAEQWKKWEQEEKARLEEERQADLEELERLNSMKGS